MAAAHLVLLILALVLFFVAGLLSASEHPGQKYAISLLAFGLAAWVASLVPGL